MDEAVEEFNYFLSHLFRSLVQVVPAVEFTIPNLYKKHQIISVVKSNEPLENILLF